MKHLENKTHSLRFRLAKLLVLAAALAFVSFQILDAVGVRVVGARIGNSDYVERMDEKYAAMLQEYIKAENLSVSDTEKLALWENEHWEVALQIFRGETLLYDSYYPDGMPLQLEDWEVPQHTRTLYFADGEAELAIYGSYGYRLYVAALVSALLVSFGVFLLTVMLGIRRTIRYIGLLSNEIRVMETGELDHPITVQGMDELAALAGGLDDMRKAFREQTRREAHLAEAYRNMITGMSHDLRTPLTALLIYTEMLSKRKFQDEEQMWSYIEKINKKAHQMKRLSDRIFEYALSSGREEPPRMERVLCRDAFYDLFSELESYLRQKGFAVDAVLEWPDHSIWICREYVIRILDNLVSNIEKYAEPDMPVTIRATGEDGYAGFRIGNHRRGSAEDMESSHIGLQNVRNMMDSMGGRCMVDGEGEVFQAELLFRF